VTTKTFIRKADSEGDDERLDRDRMSSVGSLAIQVDTHVGIRNGLKAICIGPRA
jgi:hypothetical protein